MFQGRFLAPGHRDVGYLLSFYQVFERTLSLHVGGMTPIPRSLSCSIFTFVGVHVHLFLGVLAWEKKKQGLSIRSTSASPLRLPWSRRAPRSKLRREPLRLRGRKKRRKRQHQVGRFLQDLDFLVFLWVS